MPLVGHKRDIWMAIDPHTGTKLQTLTMDGAHNTCPSTKENTLFIGKTGLYLSASKSVLNQSQAV